MTGARLAILSDIHGNLPALEAVIADAASRGVDAFVNLGDCLSGPLWPRETADRLIALDWPTVAGNQDRALVTLGPEAMGASDRFAATCLDARHLAWLGALPPTLAPMLPMGSDLFLCHGTPGSDMIYLLEDVGADGARPADPDVVAARIGARREAVILCGHTHIPRVLRLADGRTVANPGSVGLPAYADDMPLPHVMETGSPDARYAILEGDGVELIAVAYDCASAADKALAEGREDWAIALRTGRAR